MLCTSIDEKVDQNLKSCPLLINMKKYNAKLLEKRGFFCIILTQC